MGSIPSGFGIISGFDTATLIEQMLAYQARGRARVEARIGLLQARRSAMLDINAGLLAMAGTTSSISSSDLFQTLAASSSHPSLLGVTASADAAAGLYQFTVAGLASNHQLLSSGFASQASALGLMSGSIELGEGGLSVDMPLSWLNGGEGVSRGEIEITNEQTGDSMVVDLRDVATLDEVIGRINDNNLGLTASLAGGGIRLDSETGFEFSIASVGGSTTAQDLGISGTSLNGAFDGDSLARLGDSLSLAALNDGNGVLVREGLADIRITSSDGRIFDIDLSQGTLVDLSDDTLLSALNGGSGVFIDQDSEDPDLAISVVDNGSGSTASWEIDLTGCVTVGDVRDRIDSATSGNVSLDMRSDGRGLSLTANDGADLVIVEGAGTSGTTTASGLGILNESGSLGGFDGSDIAPVGTGGAPSIQAVLDAINSALDLDGQSNSGAIVAQLSADAQRLELIDSTGGTGTMTVQATAANTSAYRDLGFDGTPVMGNVMTGNRIIGGPGTVLVHELHGGDGLAGADSLTITDRFGTTASTSGFAQYETVDALVEAINTWASDQGLRINLALDASGTGLELTSLGGNGTFTVAGDLAQQLGLDASGSMDSIRSGNLQHRWVSESMELADMNQGRGIGTGTFRIRDELGATATVTITSGHHNLQDVIDLINSRGLAVQARVNDQGDGLALVSTVASEEAIVPMKVETTSGTAASDLNLVGESNAIIDGSWETTLEVDGQTTLQELVELINASGAEVTASLVNTGDPVDPWRLNLTSGVSGAPGKMVLTLDGLEAEFEEVVAGRDAKVVLGDDVATGVLITSSSNRIEGVIQGLTIDLLQASEDLVTITVERDDTAPIDSIRSFVDSINAVLERLDNYSGYDPETQVRGVLHGDSTTSRIRSALLSAIQGRGLSEEFSLEGPWAVGIRMGAGGRVEFDEEVFAEAWSNDRDSVEAFFTSATDDVAGNGFGTTLDELADRLTRVDSGTLVTADRAWEGRIGLAMSRLERLDARLEARRSQLLSEFMAMEEALASMQNQYMALMSISSGTTGLSSLFR